MGKHAQRVMGVLAVTAFISLPLIASAQTTDVNAQVQSLLSQIASLQQQLQSLLASVHASSSPWMASTTMSSMPPPNFTMASSSGSMHPSMMPPCLNISSNLSVGSSGSDVSALQGMLSAGGFLNASSTGFFGSLTQNALARFQAHFGIASSTGFFGPLTRAFLGAHCGGSQQGSSMMGSSTPPTPWGNGSSTQMWMPHATGTPMMPPPWGGTGSSSMGGPMQCQQGQGASALFVLHTIAPGMFNNPCPPTSGGGGN